MDDRVQVLASRLPIDVTRPTALRRETMPEIKFVVDVHLGSLRSHLRLMGFDTAYDNATDDARLAEQSATEGRILLTRDRNLLKRKVKSAVSARVRSRFDSFRQCSGFGRIYWAGSHYHKLCSVVGLVIGNAGQTKR